MAVFGTCRKHPCSEEHSSLVESYRLAREVWERKAKEATSGYATEMAEYQRSHPGPTFKQWLVMR